MGLSTAVAVLEVAVGPVASLVAAGIGAIFRERLLATQDFFFTLLVHILRTTCETILTFSIWNIIRIDFERSGGTI